MGNFLVKTALAGEGYLARIVPDCHFADCGLNDLAQMGVNIINALIHVTILATTLFIVIGGFRMMVSLGNEDRLKEARASVRAAIVGLVITLVAWIVIDFAISVLTPCEGRWWVFEEFTCGG